MGNLSRNTMSRKKRERLILHRKQSSLPSLGQSVTEYSNDLETDPEAEIDAMIDAQRGRKRRGSQRLHGQHIKSQSSSDIVSMQQIAGNALRSPLRSKHQSRSEI